MRKILEEPYCNECNNIVKTMFNKLLPDELEYINQKKTCGKYEKGMILYDEGSRINGF